MKPSLEPPKVSFVSLGCAKNLVDSEVLLGRLARGGFTLCADYEDSDVVVVNTCGFLQSSERESMQTIDRMVELKKKGSVKAVVVAGCLPQRYGAAWAERLRHVDAVLGIGGRDDIAEICEGLLAASRRRTRPLVRVTADLPRYEIDRDRLRLTPRHTAYVRISEGCNHTCAFCVIPKIRGTFRSKPIEGIVDEVRELASDGTKEINLIAQDTTNYGLDRYGKLCLEKLLEELSSVEGIEWIRLLYCYPTFVTDRLIRALANLPKVVKYIDMPIQHTRETVLRRMRRGITEKRQKELIAKLREEVPGLVLRTTVIVGFPGETEAEFEGLLDDLAQIRFERLGTFMYSREPDTAAEEMDGQVPEAVQRERFDRVMRQQQDIVMRFNASLIGRVLPVLVERETGSSWQGRTYGDAPEVDTFIILRGSKLSEGLILPARVTGFRGYDLVGEVP
ncbi:MAG: 30S ribosomal protein S12 methylthiotransferase RimO [Planctomycetes bacterium]|nr:30S ribosomal protein S12 methylthiotransferase RimO [Planctomycetota bacterium]